MITPETIPATDTPSGTGALVAGEPSADNPHWTDTLLDGTRVLIRPIRPADALLEKAFIEGLSPASRRYRFLGTIREPDEALLRQLTCIDYHTDAAFIALLHREGEKRAIGISRFSLGTDGDTCECAVTVADEWQRKGLGAALMRHLIGVARTRGIRTMVSHDAASNSAMQDLARFLGFRRSIDPGDPTQVVHTLALSP
jgi:GNAT superfamily N-acetyltransferase